jgi:UDPglucose 6-dehydrogenase
MIGILDLDLVGRTVAEAFDAVGIPTIGYDRDQGIGSPEEFSLCSVVFVCVPTPSGPDGELDLGGVDAAIREVEPYLGPGTIVAIASTVPPGTCDRLAAAYPRIELASVPEFVVTSHPQDSYARPDRIVIGARSQAAAAAIAELMSRIAPEAPAVFVDPIEAELVKLCSNALLAAKVSMANELAEICARFGVRWSGVQAVVGLDRRIGPDHLTVTGERGFGGDRLPTDLDGLIAASRAEGYEPELLEEIAGFNRRVREHVRSRERIGA